MPTRIALRKEMEEARDRTDGLFALINPEALYERPIPERNPLIFYLGHLEAFDWNQICRWTLGMSSFHETFDQLFEAGIDPQVGATPSGPSTDWPSVDEVRAYNQRIRQMIDKVWDEVPESVLHVALEHRLMHAETNAYLLHHLDGRYKPDAFEPVHLPGEPPVPEMVDIPEGMTILGRRPGDSFGWDNEFSEHEVQVPAFSISRYKVTNHQYLHYVLEGGDPPPFWIRRGEAWWLRTMFQEVPLPLAWPVYVTHRHALQYSRWAGLALPTEAQFHRAAYGHTNEAEHPFPWGGHSPSPQHGNFNFACWNPVPVTGHPEGDSVFGVAQLVGNGWEWTATPFAPFEGFCPIPTYPGYSSRFFDDDHFVVKGAGPQTAGRLLRRSFRNWFRQEYPYAHTGFRCVRNISSSS
jgi:gamma-glutamyl hercynylcysteine S-oxide synthase